MVYPRRDYSNLDAEPTVKLMTKNEADQFKINQEHKLRRKYREKIIKLTVDLLYIQSIIKMAESTTDGIELSDEEYESLGYKFVDYEEMFKEFGFNDLDKRLDQERENIKSENKYTRMLKLEKNELEIIKDLEQAKTSLNNYCLGFFYEEEREKNGGHV